MALEEYARKRQFTATPEPRGTVAARKRQRALTFVVQLHHARARHYDFRLEVDGVLRSWAVPKGPSFRPGEKRLAVEVEDHPMSYSSFEGEIPVGNYGAGHVAVFDRGMWVPTDDPATGIANGKLEFELKGAKLRGYWKLVRTGKAASKPQWLLLKRDDEYAGDFECDDLLGQPDEPAAAASGTPPRKVSQRTVPSGNASGTPPASRNPGGRGTRIAILLAEAAQLDGATFARKARAWVEPMLTTRAAKPPAGEEWLHEWKWDGYRLTASIESGKVAMASRNGLPWHDRLPHLVDALRTLGVDAVVDGELVAMDARGQSDFNALQRSLKSGRTDGLSYVLFDLMQLGPTDLSKTPLVQRKELLRRLIDAHGPYLGYSDHIVGHGAEVFAVAVKQKLEGIISKRVDSQYRSGRGSDWLKVKPVETREFAVVGYTRPKGSRAGLGALLLAMPEGKSWKYVGRVGSGLADADLAALPSRLRPTTGQPAVKLPPHVVLPDKAVTWVRPDTVVEVFFRGWGKEGLLRQASFSRLRDDRSVDASMAQPEPAAGDIAPPSSPGRIVFPDAGITKQQVFDFYLGVADRLLEEIGGRPLSIVRCPDGIGGQHFFQKHAGPGFGAAVRRLPPTENDGDRAEYFYVDDIAGLMNLVQMNALEFHPWSSHVDTLEQPDRLVFDLDPDTSIEWKDIKAAAVEVRDRLRAVGLESWPKLSGGKGVHVVVPIQPLERWEQTRAFCAAFAHAMTLEQPERYVATASKAKREGRIFIDWLRNGRGSTSVASWSLRARAGAPVAVPLTWEQLARIRTPGRYTLRDASRLTVPALVSELEALRQRLPITT